MICSEIDEAFAAFNVPADKYKSADGQLKPIPDPVAAPLVDAAETNAKKKMESWYDSRVWIYDDKKSNNADDILDKAISVTRKYGVKFWVLDNLLVLDINAKDTDLYEKQK